MVLLLSRLENIRRTNFPRQREDRSIPNRRAGLSKPVESRSRERRPNLRQHMGVVAVEPDQLFGLEHLRVDKASVDRSEGQGLEAEHLLFGAVDLAFTHEDEVLDPDAVFARLVVTW